MRTRITRIALILMAAVVMASCAHRPPKPTTAPTTGSDSTASTSQFNGGNPSQGQALTGDAAALAELQKSFGMVIYFDYDRSDIKSEYNSVLAAHAKFLNGGATRKVRLEGHTDERGSREYNIGLGERRAQAVRRALLLQGVKEDQITTVSYGEERPAVAGSDEAAYAKNRRVELVYGQ